MLYCACLLCKVSKAILLTSPFEIAGHRNAVAAPEEPTSRVLWHQQQHWPDELLWIDDQSNEEDYTVAKKL